MAASPLFANNASTTVSSGGTDAPVAGTVETWTVASTASFPAAVAGRTIFKIQDPAAPSEVVEVTSNTSVTLTQALTASGNPVYTALPVTATPSAVAAGDILSIEPALRSGYLPTACECSAAAAAGATSIPVDGFTPYPDTTGASSYAIGTLVMDTTNPSALASTTWTVVRGAEGTTPVAHAAGFTIEGVLSATPLAELLFGAGFYLPCLTTSPVGQIGLNIAAANLQGFPVLARLYGPPSTVTSVVLEVTTTSTGSIDVGVYSGRTAGVGDGFGAPGALMTHTGLISVPAVGVATISLPSSIVVLPGDWFSIAGTDTTAEYLSASHSHSSNGFAFGTGQLYGEATMDAAVPPLSQFVKLVGNDQAVPLVVVR